MAPLRDKEERMKKILSILLMLSVLFASLSLFSCKKEEPEAEEEDDEDG